MRVSPRDLFDRRPQHGKGFLVAALLGMTERERPA